MSDPAVKSRQAERSAATRRALLRAARRLFLKHGYAGTGVDAVAERARVTRGALYHHFPNKQELFQAVFEDVERELKEAVAAAEMEPTDPWERMRAGAHALLDRSLDAAVRRICLQEGPSVLGWETWRSIDARYAPGLIVAALRWHMAEGRIQHFDVDLLARVVLGAVREAALTVASDHDPDRARQEAGRILDALLQGLLVEGPGPGA